MERPIFQPVGTPVKELDTPALLLDLDVATSNIQTLHQFFRDTSAKVRPHVGCHQCPRLAHLQMAAGGTVGESQSQPLERQRFLATPASTTSW